MKIGGGTMKALIIYSHPNPNSFNGAILKTAVEILQQGNHEVRVKDLYAMSWNPLLTTTELQKIYSGEISKDVEAEHNDIKWADMLIFIYPIWWFEQPAILKGWLDRVFCHGFAYRLTPRGMMEGLLKGKKAVVITTSGANEENMRHNGILDAIKTCMLKGTLGFSGFEDIQYENLYSVPTSTDEERQKMLSMVTGLFEGMVQP
jgi:NAD(P)H dehydrogenase (quinone)